MGRSKAARPGLHHPSQDGPMRTRDNGRTGSGVPLPLGPGGAGRQRSRPLVTAAANGQGERMTRAGKDADEPGPDVLTPRERDVVAGLARGQTYEEIASELGLTFHTVSNYAR